MWGPILDTAVRYANDYLQLRMGHIFPHAGDIFKPPNDYTKLELHYEPQTVAGPIAVAKARGRDLRSEDEIYDELTVIVRDAVQRAIVEEGPYFAGLIVEHMRATGELPWQT